MYRKTSNKRPGGNKFQMCHRPGYYWRQAFIRGIYSEAFFKLSVPKHPSLITGRLLLEARRLLSYHIISYHIFSLAGS